MWHHTGGEFESCDECRFDGSAYTDEDVAGTLRNLAGWAGATVVGLDDEMLARRPSPAVWSPAEYLRHTKRVLWVMAGLAELTQAEPSPGSDGHVVDGEPPRDASADDPTPDIDARREIARINDEAMRLHELWVHADAGARGRSITVNGQPADLAGIVRHAIHDATHHLSDIGRGVVALGAGAPPQTGRVARANASGGGVPKLALDEATVGYRGVSGDRQAVRRHHGRVWQALCLWSSEVIDALVTEGHPVSMGSAGENFTLAGIDWSSLRPGARLRIGNDVVAECTMWAAPCNTLVASFTEGDFRRIDVHRHPGFARMYAKVLADGIVRQGDLVRVF